VTETEKDPLAIGLGALACGVGMGGGTIGAALIAVRMSQHVTSVSYGAKFADTSLDLYVGLVLGIAVAAGFGWRRSRPLHNEWQGGVVSVLAAVGALLTSFLAVPFWQFFHFWGLGFWIIANFALGAAGSAWAVRGAGAREA
jgi:hypothetical protein